MQPRSARPGTGRRDCGGDCIEHFLLRGEPLDGDIRRIEVGVVVPNPFQRLQHDPRLAALARRPHRDVAALFGCILAQQAGKHILDETRARHMEVQLLVDGAVG